MSDKRRIFYALCLNMISVGVEVVVGIFSGSVSILADASHNFTDSLIIITTLVGLQQNQREANDKATFGFGRTSIVITMFNGVLTLALAGFIFYEAFNRFIHPQPIHSLLVFFAATLVACLNGSIAYISYKAKDISTKMVYLPNLADALSSSSIAIGSLILFFNPKLTFIDPLLATIIGFVVIFSITKVFKEALDILMEKTPKGLNLEKVIAEIKSHSMVQNVHDLHAWTVSSGVHALSAHVSVSNCTMEVSNKTANEIKKKLKEKFCIDHATLEMECQHAEDFDQGHAH